MGCSGAVDVRIERLDDDPITREWLTVLERGDGAVLATPLSGTSGRVLVRATGEIVGGLTESAVEREAVAHARAELAAEFPQSGPAQIGSSEVFFEISAPSPELVIFGAGHDIVPLAQQATMLDFAVTIVDVRTAYLTVDRFPNARLVSAHFNQFVDTVQLASGSFVLVMNHHVERDQASLQLRARFRGRVHRCARAARRDIRNCSPAWRLRAMSRPHRASRACGARSAYHSARRHQRKWPSPFWAKFWRFDAASRAAFSAARLGSLHRSDARRLLAQS